MKFQRNVRMLKGQLDFAPFASVFFCLLIFILLLGLTYTPGEKIVLPAATADMPGASGPAVRVGLVASGQLYYENQRIKDVELRRKLLEAVKSSSEPLTMIVMADKDVAHGEVTRLADLGYSVGITNIVEARQPRPFDAAFGQRKAP